jgi:hypothetical protein
MLDVTTPGSARFADWKSTIAVGDIVVFTFPCAENGVAPKARPCLVIDIDRRDDRTLIELAYGTSVDTGANCGDEIRVRTPDGMRNAGLDRPTRFVAARRVMVSSDHPGFCANVNAAKTPIIGRLDASLMERLHVIRARMHAVRDIVAERRSPGAQRVIAASGASVVVEWRNRRREARERAQIAAGRRIAR